MAVTQLGRQFIELAIEIEKNGRTFYEAVGRQGKDRQVQEIFKRLASREKDHERTFHEMLSRLAEYVPPQTPDRDLYIRDLAGTAIFAGEKAQVLLSRRNMTDIEAVEAGIGFEKDSILFYTEVRGMVPANDGNIIDMIADEERKHLSELVFMANRIRRGV